MVGVMDTSLHAGKACQNGVFAAQTRRSFTDNLAAIEAPKGFAVTATGQCDQATGLAERPRGWHIRNLFKIDASC
jgi:hypothetical protein